MPPSRASCCASCRVPTSSQRQARSVWEFAGPRLQGSRAALAFVAITAAVTAVVGIINPALSQVFMDRLLGGKNPEWLYPFIALLIAVGAVRIVVEVLNAMYLLRLEGKMAVVSNSSFMWKVLHLPWSSSRSAWPATYRLVRPPTPPSPHRW